MQFNSQKPLVLIIMGSDSDAPIMSETVATLKSLQIPFDTTVASAHRTPERVKKLSEQARSQGIEAIIAAAGAAAHLAGVVASHTTLPVIGIPLASSSLNGLDALLSTVQMPGGIPVATMAIGKSGAQNAALFAASILSIKYPEIQDALDRFRANMALQVEKKAEKVKVEFFA